jgi:hypothetical protein
MAPLLMAPLLMAPLLMASVQSLLIASFAVLSLAIASFFWSWATALPAAKIKHTENIVAVILFMADSSNERGLKVTSTYQGNATM